MGVTVTTPLGKAVGVRTFKEIRGGITALPEGKPAVVTKPMPGGARTAAPPKLPVTASSDSSVASGRLAGTALASTAEPKPKPASSDPEVKAKRLLQMGNSYLASGMTALAKKKFQELVTKYPDTKVAPEAKKRLLECE